METIQRFKTFCGKIFDTKEEALRYEKISKKVDNILSKLFTPKDEECSFSNGEGYIQHSSDFKESLESDIVRLANEWFNPKEPYTHFNYYLGRVIDDSGMSCLNRLSYKLMCIDDKNREWGQPYFALNPGKGNQKQLN